MKQIIEKYFEGIKIVLLAIMNKKRGNRLLQDKNFQIDDTTFRKYINILFDAMRERNLLESLRNKKRTLIELDFQRLQKRLNYFRNSSIIKLMPLIPRRCSE